MQYEYDPSDLFSDELKEAMADGRVIVKFSDTSDEDNQNIQLSVEPAPPEILAALREPPEPPEPPAPVIPVDVAVARLEAQLEAAQESVDDWKASSKGWEARYNSLVNQRQEGPKVIEKNTHTIKHRRCWGSLLLSLLVAIDIYANHREWVEGVFQYVRTQIQ